MSDDKDSRPGCNLGCFGCLSIILFCFVLWALIFGVTFGGIHYFIECSAERGVEVHHGAF